ncbi:hypothetical protein PENTCL1PPCAC_12152 [Pristionchus entomophagus]|uniref:Secreted protein n=1 Tax=Pristionchus entomophagus TaxID=358040 RepID=A0AAV5T4T4_9BILA|nr:hypothetical protein PENTCL1PPCAC_12152 [Pristionchus entomophagus]
MPPTIYLLFGLITTVLGNVPCVEYSAVCVPAHVDYSYIRPFNAAAHAPSSDRVRRRQPVSHSKK